jgi:hypothetical protein
MQQTKKRLIDTTVWSNFATSKKRLIVGAPGQLIQKIIWRNINQVNIIKRVFISCALKFVRLYSSSYFLGSKRLSFKVKN